MTRILKNTLYITDEQSFLSLENENIIVKVGNEKKKIPLNILQNVISFSYAGITVPLMQEICSRKIGLTFIDKASNEFVEINGVLHGNVMLRKEQYRQSENESISLSNYARYMISAKILNHAAVIRRLDKNRNTNSQVTIGKSTKEYTANEVIDYLISQAETVLSLDPLSADTLLGIEGDSARRYFQTLGTYIQNPAIFENYSGRTKRPPLDEINAMLSLLYVLLSQDCRNACYAAGLDPYIGFFHTERSGKPALALDLMEEMRALVDRFTITMINKRQLTEKHFEHRIDGSVLLTDKGRKKLITQWQLFKQKEFKHPITKEKITYGLLPYVQAQLLAQTIRGDYERYIPFVMGSTL